MKRPDLESLRGDALSLECLEELEERCEMQFLPAQTEWCGAFDCQGDCGGGQLCATYCSCKGTMCECLQEYCIDLCGRDYTS